MKYAEVVSTPENARLFLDHNKIKDSEIREIVIVWEEGDGEWKEMEESN